MSTARPQQVIIFSAGESVRNGNVGKVKAALEAAGHRCYGWQELFTGAKRKDKIALLPMLIKKIPTFDFAIILGDAVDLLAELRDEEVQAWIMRDNILFESGLCIMALGADRVILLIEDDIRIPDDFHGVASDEVVFDGVGKLGVEYHQYSNEEVGELESKLERILSYIESKAGEIYPVVIGAAISTADGYFNNFILRFWENIPKGFVDLADMEAKPIKVEQEKIRMKILIPRVMDEALGGKIRGYYEANGYRKGMIQDGQFRGVEFWHQLDAEGNLTVCDIPSTVTASYNTVVDILQLDADDEQDADARGRFLAKELDSFVRTLGKVMKEDKVAAKARSFRKPPEEVERLVDGVKRVSVESVGL